MFVRVLFVNTPLKKSLVLVIPQKVRKHFQNDVSFYFSNLQNSFENAEKMLYSMVTVK